MAARRGNVDPGGRALAADFERHNGKNGRLSIQTDPRLYQDPNAIVEQAERFSRLAPNMIVKIPVDCSGRRGDRRGHLPGRQHQRDR